MERRFKDAEHLWRLAAVFAAGFVVFVVGRGLLIPKGFGDFGFYRGGALQDNRDRAFVFAGRQACADCHGDVVAAKAAGAHAGVGCEACHGPLAAHASDPTTGAPALPVPAQLCPVCHTRNAAKPAGFPQVVPDEHSGGESCATCHAPHSPAIP